MSRSIAVAGLLLCGGAAQACKPAPDYVQPTNFELVSMADAIVVGEAVDGESDPQPSFGATSVTFRTGEVLKGHPPPVFKIQDFRLGRPTPSDPTELLEPNKEAFEGSCERRTFARGAKYVLFLTKVENGAYREVGGVFSRVSEDYTGEDSLWVTTIREYLGVQAEPDPTRQLAMLTDHLHALLRQPQTGGVPERERDLAWELTSPSPHKPTGFLVDAFRNLERDDGRFPTIEGMSEAETRTLDALVEKPFQGYTETADDRRRFAEDDRADILRFLRVRAGDADARAFFDDLLSRPNPSPAALGAAIRFLAADGQRRRAFDLAEQALARLDALTGDEDKALSADIAAAFTGREDCCDVPSPERWLSDDHARAIWPELALSLFWHEFRRFAVTRDADLDALKSLPIKDYRVRPAVTLALAGAGDDAVYTWAVAQLTDDKQRKAWEARAADSNEEDPAKLPMEIVLVAHLADDRDEVLNRAFCAGGVRRALLFDELGPWGEDLDASLATEMAAERLTADEHAALADSMARLGARRDLAGDSDGSGAIDLAKRLARGDAIKPDHILEWRRCSKPRRVQPRPHHH